MRGHLSLVLSGLALLVALSGTAYAMGKGSVTSKSIANGAVTTPKLKDGAVTAPKLKDGAVSTAKLKNGAVVGPKIAPDAIDGRHVVDGSLRLADLGGAETARTTTLGASLSIAAGECQPINLTLFNPAPNGSSAPSSSARSPPRAAEPC